jgi:hypothetical protein
MSLAGFAEETVENPHGLQASRKLDDQFALFRFPHGPSHGTVYALKQGLFFSL